MRFHATQLRDFIFAASPDLIYFKHELDFPIHLFATGEDALPWIKGVCNRLDTVLKLLTDHYGPYPFAQLSLVRAHGRN